MASIKFDKTFTRGILGSTFASHNWTTYTFSIYSTVTDDKILLFFLNHRYLLHLLELQGKFAFFKAIVSTIYTNTIGEPPNHSEMIHFSITWLFGI